ncbi:GH36-type glycosyl hydrolase domain-containing protein [uncultured Bifidobacterium sp.]|uniref:GH36-type glycosyl hydrolase domain-containing protein n=1 Tax=uncultured Bifidobacterium sp. TaxID=165187 RepID=UPI0028DBAB4E|nr:amylo-alpha-1,6-glucosidase [uncultured Bifidobacterium sp.]
MMTSKTTGIPLRGSAAAPLRAVASGGLRIALTANGDIRKITCGDLQISQYEPTDDDSGVAGIWLRRLGAGNRVDAALPLIGALSASSWTCDGRHAGWRGEDDRLGISWTVWLAPVAVPESSGIPGATGWMWSVRVAGRTTEARSAEWDLVTAQDLALAPQAQAMSSEPYVSQYVAFRCAEDDGLGTVLSARQTMASAPVLPLFATVMAQGVRGCLTDGFDFHGRRARMGEPPKALSLADWGTDVNQYEFAMACLDSRPIHLSDDGRMSWDQLCICSPDYRGPLDGLAGCVRDALRSLDGESDDSAGGDPLMNGMWVPPRPHAMARIPVLNGDAPDETDLVDWSGGRILSPETDADGRLLSFFTPDAGHVVSQAKELEVDRSHGQILLAGVSDGNIVPMRPTMATTTYAAGVFASHLVLGNTNLNRLLSVQRNALNLCRSAGVRLFVRNRGGWRVLGEPSAFRMDIGGSRWLYRLEGRSIEVRTVAEPDADGFHIRVSSSSPTDMVMTMNVEDPHLWQVVPPSADGRVVMLTPARDSAAFRHGVNLAYALGVDGARPAFDEPFADRSEESGSSGIRVRSGASVPRIISFRVDAATSMHAVLAASLKGAERASRLALRMLGDGSSYSSLVARHVRSVSDVSCGLVVRGEGRLSEVNLLIPWFVQNALVHLLSPHGLEQYSGAAWGTRDVCQGPFEMALAFGRFDDARAILLEVFRHQATDGSLPQWFMFDEYAELFQREAHGDIPVWPMMALAEYLRTQEDASILEERVPFRDASGMAGGAHDSGNGVAGDGTATVLDHVRRTLRYIRGHRVPGTAIYSYGEGDWDDTLQPAQESLKKRMASSWTIALLFQASRWLATELRRAGHEDDAREFDREAAIIGEDYPRDFIVDGVLAGYVVFGSDGSRPVIHPKDDRTGLRYRLIPMTQAVVAGLFTPSQAADHMRLIEEHLHYPDGVRLMDRPAMFQDGVTSVFRRAEQAANIGREIGLMYTHAHIRYAEALAALGDSGLVRELLRISPVGQFSRLSTSEPRQRNCYFASSDADFPDRYTATREWDRLRAGSSRPVGVRGGWRVYSSGPGIYLRMIMQHVFGLTVESDRLIVDPVLDAEDDGTVIDVRLFGRKRTIRYTVSPSSGRVSASADGRELAGDHEDLPYRSGGLVISRESLDDADLIDVTVPLRTASARESR